jgi:hypothetical protein
MMFSGRKCVVECYDEKMCGVVVLIVLEEMSGRWIAGDDGVGDELAPRGELLHEAVASFICP